MSALDIAQAWMVGLRIIDGPAPTILKYRAALTVFLYVQRRSRGLPQAGKREFRNAPTPIERYSS
jgi:hypothetical protein